MKIDDTLVMKVHERARQLTEDAVSFLRDLVALPSESTGEREVAARIAKEMASRGFATHRIDSVGNALGTIGSGPVHVWYDSHIDTVGIGDRSRWPHDPYTGKVENGVIFGRGTSDNKAAIATMVIAGQILRELNLLDGVTMTMIGTVQEEDCDGAALRIALDAAEKRPDFLVLGECTNLDIYRGHRGRTELEISISGKPCHASAPDRGRNPLYKAGAILQELERLNERLLDHDFLGKGTIAATFCETSTGSYNTVPDRCTIICDRRMTLGETKESVLKEVQDLLDPADCSLRILPYDRASYTGHAVKQEKFFPTWLLPEDHVLVQAGVDAATSARGNRPGIDKWVFSTNGVASMGTLGIPTIGFGPSEERFAHTLDDQVTIEHLYRSVAFYALFPMYLMQRSS